MDDKDKQREEDWSAEKLIARVVETLDGLALTVDEVREHFRDPEVIAVWRGKGEEAEDGEENA